jgi:hypothetical protein
MPKSKYLSLEVTRATVKFGDFIMHPDGYEVQVVGGFIFNKPGDEDIIRYRKRLPSGKLSLNHFHEKSWIL